MHVTNYFMGICQNGPLDLFMHSSALCILLYGVIKSYAVHVYATRT